MNSRRANAPNVHLLADHVCFTPNGGHWRGVIGTSAPEPVRMFASPEAVEHRSPTTLREKLIKIGAKVVRHGRYITFEPAEVAIPRDPFADILRRIDRLRPRVTAKATAKSTATALPLPGGPLGIGRAKGPFSCRFAR